jgi:RimJ/RimL family protein N-acetyltransferase/ketosteroid isomerase-like protein
VTERLETDRLALRRPADGDSAGYEAVLGEDDAPRELRDALAHWRAHGFGPWLVEEDGEPVGVLEIHFAGPGVKGIQPDEVEVGWTVARANRGRGIAVEAARAAIADAFDRTGASRLVAYIRPENVISIKVAQRVGMRHAADGLTRSGDAALIYRIGAQTSRGEDLAAQLTERTHAWWRALRDRDWTAARAFMRDDFLITTAGWIDAPIGPDAWLETLAGRYTLRRFDYDQVIVRDFGDVAVVLSRSHQEGTMADTGAEWAESFRYTDAWVRDAGGEWRIATRHAGIRPRERS